MAAESNLMRTSLLTLTLTATLGLAAHKAHADNTDVDVSAFEYIDVVETSDGSVWKGVVIEQTPNVRYKIATADGSLHVIQAGDVVKMAKAKNPGYHVAQQTTTASTAVITPAGGGGGGGGGGDVKATYHPHHDGLPAPYATSGLRLDPEFATVIPLGVMSDAMTGTSFGAGFRAGYELLFGNFGLTVGEQTRMTWWQLPGDPKDVAWTLETLAFARAALHVGRVAPYATVAAGLDTNYIYAHAFDLANTSLGFGLDLGAGVSIAASPNIAIDIGADFHPGTDTLNDLSPMSASSEYLAMHIGASIRL
jgi:opacity protein-like surface antigen